MDIKDLKNKVVEVTEYLTELNSTRGTNPKIVTECINFWSIKKNEYENRIKKLAENFDQQNLRRNALGETKEVKGHLQNYNQIAI